MLRSAHVAILAASLFVGCSAPVMPPLSSDHPASPDAAEAPLPPASTTLSLAEGVPVDPVAGQTPASSGHAGHGDDDHHSNADDGDTPSVTQPHHDDRAVTPKPGASATQPAEQAFYSCSMHPEVVSDKPGKCPKCGMKLIKKTLPDAGDGGRHEH